MKYKTEKERLEAIRRAKKKYRQSKRGQEVQRRHWKKYYPGYKERALAAHRRVKYGITEEEFERRKAEQEGCCAICEQTMESPQVDHCHQTGEVRGLLCGSCNKALGLMRDDTYRLAKAILYLNGTHD